MVSPVKTTSTKKKASEPSIIRLMFALFLIMVVQFVFVAQFASRLVRVDVLLIAPLYLALTVPLFTAIVISCLIGFVMDVLTGGFIGFHMFLYVAVVILVALIEQKINLSGIFQQFITLTTAWLFEGVVLQVFSLILSNNVCEFCIFSKLFVYKTLTLMGFGLILLILIPFLSGHRIRGAAG